MVSTSNYEMRGSLFLGIDGSVNLKFRIAIFPDSETEEERFYCFKMGNPPSKEAIITQLDSLINRY